MAQLYPTITPIISYTGPIIAYPGPIIAYPGPIISYNGPRLCPISGLTNPPPPLRIAENSYSQETFQHFFFGGGVTIK